MAEDKENTDGRDETRQGAERTSGQDRGEAGEVGGDAGGGSGSGPEAGPAAGGSGVPGGQDSGPRVDEDVELQEWGVETEPTLIEVSGELSPDARSFYVEVEDVRRRGKQDQVYHLAERYRDPSSPFEKQRRLATFVDGEAALRVQQLLDQTVSNEERAREERPAGASPHVADNGSRGPTSAYVERDSMIPVIQGPPGTGAIAAAEDAVAKAGLRTGEVGGATIKMPNPTKPKQRAPPAKVSGVARKKFNREQLERLKAEEARKR